MEYLRTSVEHQVVAGIGGKGTSSVSRATVEQVERGRVGLGSAVDRIGLSDWVVVALQSVGEVSRRGVSTAASSRVWRRVTLSG